jgi:hypothetical protein
MTLKEFGNYSLSSSSNSSSSSSSSSTSSAELEPWLAGVIRSNIETDKIYFHQYFSSVILDSFSCPDRTGLAIEAAAGWPWGELLISASNITDKIYVHSRFTSSIISSFASPGDNIQGLGMTGWAGNLLSSDCDSDKIYVHSGISATILSSFSAVDIEGVDCSWTNLLTIRTPVRWVQIHDGISSTILSTYSIEFYPTGAALDTAIMFEYIVGYDEGGNAGIKYYFAEDPTIYDSFSVDGVKALAFFTTGE